MSIFAVPNREVFGYGGHLERCRSGRSGRTRNAVYGQLYRGFESLSLRNKGCKSSNYEIYTLFYTQKLKQNAFAMQFYLKVLLF